MQSAMRELQIRHHHPQGIPFVDDPDRAPTGYAYKSQQQQQLQQQQQSLASHGMTTPVVPFTPKTEEDSNDKSDEEWMDSDDDEDDPVLEAMRQKRLQEMQQAHQQKMKELALGHGQVRTIVQDEFLSECTGQSDFVAVHFFHNDYERCKIMDHHLQQVAPKHTSCKFLRIDAAKAPFFVTKLQVRTLPTLIIFHKGKAVARLVGFDGLISSSTKDPDAWETSSLQRWLATTGAIQYDSSKDDRNDDSADMNRRSNRIVHRGLVSTGIDDF